MPLQLSAASPRPPARKFTFTVRTRTITWTDGIVLSMPRKAVHEIPTGIFSQPDPSIHMLGVPRSRSRLGKWGLFVFIAGILAALVLVTLTNFLP
jgi:hypothetical protein